MNYYHFVLMMILYRFCEGACLLALVPFCLSMDLWVIAIELVGIRRQYSRRISFCLSVLGFAFSIVLWRDIYFLRDLNWSFLPMIVDLKVLGSLMLRLCTELFEVLVLVVEHCHSLVHICELLCSILLLARVWILFLIVSACLLSLGSIWWL